MIHSYISRFLILALIFSITIQTTSACSMYKVTAEGKTMVGCNEDAWRTTPHIWFVNPKNGNEYGACITGSRKVGDNAYAPQSGMNEEGLVFSRLVAFHPLKDEDQSGKKRITNEVQFLTEILQTCKTIAEVKTYIQRYDRTTLIDDVLIYVDKSGEYLIVEPYQFIKGNDPSYILGNFCPSITSNENARKQLKYKRGEDFVKENGVNTSLDYCRSMSDAMHVCRDRNGDGTLLTTIWDTKDGLVNIYFYHKYDTTVQFDLVKELAHGNRTISILTLFPGNAEFQRLVDYKTPFNVYSLRGFMALLGGFIMLLSLVYLISYFRKRKSELYNVIKLPISFLNILLFGYLFVLATNIGIFYFDAPYKGNSTLVTLSSYMPFVLLLGVLPLFKYLYNYIKSNQNNLLLKSSLVLNSFIYLCLIGAFVYWGLYDVF